MSDQKPAQQKVTMILICLFLGGFGIHRLMMGYDNWWQQLLLTIFCGVGVFWALFDLIQIATGNMGMADGRELT